MKGCTLRPDVKECGGISRLFLQDLVCLSDAARAQQEGACKETSSKVSEVSGSMVGVLLHMHLQCSSHSGREIISIITTINNNEPGAVLNALRFSCGARHRLLQADADTQNAAF